MRRLGSVDDLDWGSYLKPGDRVLWGQACAEPRTLVEHFLASRAVTGLTAFVGIPASNLLDVSHADRVRFTSYTGAGANSVLYSAGALEIIPAHYSHLPDLIARGRIGAEVVLVQLAGPDRQGRYSLGITRDYLVEAVERAHAVIAEVSSAVPWTVSGPYLTEEALAVIVPSRYAPAELPITTPSTVQDVIASNVADLVDDGSTLQLGVGSLSEAVLTRLAGRRHLGVHSGLLSDGLVDLIQGGIVTGERKTVDRGLVVGGMLYGSRKLFAFAHRNDAICLRGIRYTHDQSVLAAQHKFTALNSAVEVDLTGQVNAEVARGRYVGSVGGAVDFLRGAARSPGGIPVVMLPSKAGTVSRIVAQLNGPVSTPRSDAGVVVTEHGVADLRGLTLAERAERMIAIAAPEFRKTLTASADAVLFTRKGARLG
jgi:acetyl-CoA hydrolase